MSHFQHGESLSYNDLAALLPDLKKQYPWLADVSSVPLQQALRHLDRAFVNFFEDRANYPTFKKKQNSQSATYASNTFKCPRVAQRGDNRQAAKGATTH
jgi:putative transposase